MGLDKFICHQSHNIDPFHHTQSFPHGSSESTPSHCQTFFFILGISTLLKY